MSENTTSATPAATPSETPSEVNNTEEVSEEQVESDGAESKEAKKETKEEKKAAATAKKKYKIKVDQQEEEIEFDPSNEEELVKYLQKGKAADRRMAQAAEVRKAAIEFIEQLRKNPRKVLADPNIAVDVKQLAREIMAEELAEAEKTPEQKAQEEKEKRLLDAEERAKKLEEQIKQKEFERIQAEQERVLETEISAALDVGGIPKTPRTVARMAEMMMIALNNNIDLSPKEIAPLVKNNTMSEFKEVIASLSDDQLEDFLGKEVLGRLSKRRVAKAKAIDTASSVKPTGNDVKKKADENKDSKKMTYKDFFGV